MSSIKNETRQRILEKTWQLLEAQPGTVLSMSTIAKAAGLSRQALYLHFTSRAELLIATIRYVDDVKGLEQRLAQVEQCQSGDEMLARFIQVWGSYMPEVYGVSKALMMSKESDKATAQAWDEIMHCLYQLCERIVSKLVAEKKLKKSWSQDHAADFLFMLISFSNWEALRHQRGWTNDAYILYISKAIQATIVDDTSSEKKYAR